MVPMKPGDKQQLEKKSVFLRISHFKTITYHSALLNCYEPSRSFLPNFRLTGRSMHEQPCSVELELLTSLKQTVDSIQLHPKSSAEPAERSTANLMDQPVIPSVSSVIWRKDHKVQCAWLSKQTTWWWFGLPASHPICIKHESNS